MANYIKSKRLWLSEHPGFNEKWVQEQIEADPSMLSLGDVELRSSERRQNRAGRLDMLFQDSASTRRFVVELQLGATDESHIIRTLEYWDIEQKKYNSYEHVAVLIAEDVTTRFLNVIRLFNSTVPIMAIQMAALEVGDAMTLMFTPVLDVIQRDPDEEEVALEVVDRSYWETRASPKTVAEADKVLTTVKGFDPKLELRYNKHYVGFARDGLAYNFAVLRPRKSATNLEIRLPHSPERIEQLEHAGLDVLDYDARWGAYRVRLGTGDVDKHSGILSTFLKEAFDARGA
jgi:predicted transport protein